MGPKMKKTILLVLSALILSGCDTHHDKGLSHAIATYCNIKFMKSYPKDTSIDSIQGKYGDNLFYQINIIRSQKSCSNYMRRLIKQSKKYDRYIDQQKFLFNVIDDALNEAYKIKRISRNQVGEICVRRNPRGEPI